MATYIVLFRGINVGGNRIVKMESLRNVLTEAGFENVKTYIQSGNLVLKSGQTDRQVDAKISEIFPKTFGFESRIAIRSLDEWNGLVAKNPYPQAEENPKTLHAVILDGDPTGQALDELQNKASKTESFTVSNRTLYLHTPDGFGTSKLALALDKVLKVPLTARNWQTVLKLQEMAAAV
jgi:uncharacterized protein (DUF1697 family)